MSFPDAALNIPSLRTLHIEVSVSPFPILFPSRDITRRIARHAKRASLSANHLPLHSIRRD